MGITAADRLAQNPEPRTLQAILIEKAREIRWNVSVRSRRQRILRIVAHHDLKEAREVGDCARHRTERCMEGGPAVPHAGSTHKAGRRMHADEAVPCRWPPDRSRTFFTNSNRCKVRCEPRPRSTR